jgi:Tannase and feruloyl esterase
MKRLLGQAAVLGWASVVVFLLGPQWQRNAYATAPGCNATAIQTAIASTAPPNTTITSAIPKTSPVHFCDVKGTIATTTDGSTGTVMFEVGLPDAWNNNFLFLGNGGYAGSLQATESVPPALSQFASSVSYGFATAATDTGHESVFAGTGLESLDGSFGLTGSAANLAGREDFAYRGVHLSTLAAEAITRAYYSALMPSYFWGCSTGGRQALVEAQKFPTDYNGIIAGDPAISNPIAGFNWNEEAILQSSDTWLSPDDITLIDNAVLKECDGIDGVVDGLIQDPRDCKFKPSSLLCSKHNTSDCLTAGQVGALEAIYTGAQTPSGQQLYPGYTVSDPAGDDGWSAWITGFNTPTFAVAEPWGTPPLPSFLEAPYQWSFQDQFMKYFVFDNTGYDSLDFNFGDPSDVSQLQAIVQEYGGNGEDSDLSPFFANGGKLIMYHGWSDPALTPFVSVDYYSAVAKTLGGGFKHLQENARLFMAPGMHHCGGGPGLNVFDPLTPLIGWVEAGQAPESILAYHTDSSTGTVRTMPLCPYPQTAVFTGGDIYDATNWKCGSHTNHRSANGKTS